MTELEFLKQQFAHMRRELDDVKAEIQKLKSKSPRKHLFEKSEWFNYNKFEAHLLAKGWAQSEIKHYYASALGYSKANGAKYLDWMQAVENWYTKDKKVGTAQSKFDKINKAI